MLAVNPATGWMVYRCDACGVLADEVHVCSGLGPMWIGVIVQSCATLVPRRRFEGHACSAHCLGELLRAAEEDMRVRVFDETPPSGVRGGLAK